MRKSIVAGFGTVLALVSAGSVLAQRMGNRSGYPYESGADIYSHVCQGCHMPDAKGAQGAALYGYPALAGDPKLASGLYPAMVIVRGQKAMPAFDDLSDAQVAEVVNYVRSNFGNTFADTITAAQVKTLRPTQVNKESGRPG